MINAKFRGEWKYLNKALFEVSAKRAEKACLEWRCFSACWDDEKRISDYRAATRSIPNCSRLIMKDGSEKSLTFREVADKVIHSSRLEWEFVKFPDPPLICQTRNTEKWVWAEIDVVAVAALCGQSMS